ncbi:MAG TPA: AbrB/MazE/SpoVT family DNA-binding domain-containing protein [Candidatus Brocadiia bacterium]|nr:AbrB/MazE/SpoVT family DNA-binding domain-containing protein [Candidatus Brocadiales bacterium]
MSTLKPVVTEIKPRGQIIIPKQIRDATHLEEGQAVTVIAVGDTILVTPKRLRLDEARRQIARILKESGLSPEEVFKGLKGARESVYKEIYEKKAR